jgi:hypothetical protein
VRVHCVPDAVPPGVLQAKLDALELRRHQVPLPQAVQHGWLAHARRERPPDILIVPGLRLRRRRVPLDVAARELLERTLRVVGDARDRRRQRDALLVGERRAHDHRRPRGPLKELPIRGPRRARIHDRVAHPAQEHRARRWERGRYTGPGLGERGAGVPPRGAGQHHPDIDALAGHHVVDVAEGDRLERYLHLRIHASTWGSQRSTASRR